MASRSVTDRDAGWIQYLVIALAAGVLAAAVFLGPLTLLWSVPAAIAAVLVGAFIGFARFSGRLARDPTGHRLKKTDMVVGAVVAGWGAELEAHGFASMGTWALVGPEGPPMAGPYLLYRHGALPDVAWVASAGGFCVSALTDGRWLLTSNVGALAHPGAIAQKVPDGSMADVVEVHRASRATLAAAGLPAVADPDPIEAYHASHRRELDLMRNRGALSRMRVLFSHAVTGTLSEAELVSVAQR